MLLTNVSNIFYVSYIFLKITFVSDKEAPKQIDKISFL